jgi:formylglycine-generating enzyme required for sulfatase activity
MQGIRHLFLGFPIWDEAPSPPAHEIIRSLALKGVRVTPLFTYVHYVGQASLDGLTAEITAAGGNPSAPIALLLPALIPEEDIIARARQALLERRDLWAADADPVAKIDCTEQPAPHSARLCAVPPGSVWLGDVSRSSPGTTSNPPRLFQVPGFELDEKEISIAQYGRCVAAQRCRARQPHGVSTDLERPGDELPQPDLSWSDATTYCAFVGLRLPTEAEWVRAARGSGLDPYPWGEALPGTSPARANLGEKPSEGLAHYALAAPESPWIGDGVAGLSPGCHFEGGRGPYGHCDLVGNLLEWIDAPAPVAKGGSWIDVEPEYVRVGDRVTIEQREMGSYLTGARCARSR